MISFVIHGNTPSKKNSKQIIYKNGKPLIISSNNHATWHKDALKQIVWGNQPLTTTKEIQLFFYGKDKRKFDISNKAESILDLLVDRGVLEDDNYSVVPRLVLQYQGIDTLNPRCEIHIYD